MHSIIERSNMNIYMKIKKIINFVILYKKNEMPILSVQKYYKTYHEIKFRCKINIIQTYHNLLETKKKLILSYQLKKFYHHCFIFFK